MLQTWAEERDTLLRDIGARSTELQDLTKATTEKGQNLSALHVSIAEATGRLIEIEALEARHRSSVSADIAELEIRKTRLEGDCATLEARAKGASEKYEITNSATAEIVSTHEIIREQGRTIASVVGDVAEKVQKLLLGVQFLITEIETVSTRVIDKSTENVTQTNIVLKELPRYIFELQKPLRIRRTYAEPAKITVAPVKK